MDKKLMFPSILCGPFLEMLFSNYYMRNKLYNKIWPSFNLEEVETGM